MAAPFSSLPETKAMAALINCRTFRIEWGQCDPAGIVFYPQFLVIFDASTGQLFSRTGLSAAEMRRDYGIIGMPLVEQGARFLLPCRFDDEVTVESEAGDWGRASFTMKHRILKKGQLAVDGFEKRVWAAADPERPGHIKSIPVPAEIIACLSDPTGTTLCRPAR
jgi:4-hydroxybenzoyl-CoA thioesterase